MKSVEELDVYQYSHTAALIIYGITKEFPPEERYGLVTQMRRTAYSIPMNLAEGSHRLNRKEYRQFVGIAKGSAGEMKYQLLLARDLGYIDENIYNELRSQYERISQILTGLAKSLA
jgi:four helix bundle protein